MDRFGVDRSLAIPFPVVEDHRAAHDLIGRAVRAHPGPPVPAPPACDPFVAERRFPRRSPALPRAVRLPRAQAAAAVPRPEPVLRAERLLLRDGARKPHGGDLPHRLRPALRAALALHDARAQVPGSHALSLAHCGRRHLRARGDPGGHPSAPTSCWSFPVSCRTMCSKCSPHVPSGRLMIGSDLPESLRRRNRQDPGARHPRTGQAQHPGGHRLPRVWSRMKTLKGAAMGAGYFSRFQYEAWTRIPGSRDRRHLQPHRTQGARHDGGLRHRSATTPTGGR